MAHRTDMLSGDSGSSKDRERSKRVVCSGLVAISDIR